MGKSIAAGIPLGAYGMTPRSARGAAATGGRDDAKPQVAVGGTLFGNPVSMAAARATMGEVLTDEAYAHSQRLGGRLADGLDRIVEGAGLALDRASVLAAQRSHLRAIDAADAAEATPCTSTSRCVG